MNKQILLLVPFYCLVDTFKIVPIFFVKMNFTRIDTIKNTNEQKITESSLFSDKNIINTVAFLLF